MPARFFSLVVLIICLFMQTAYTAQSVLDTAIQQAREKNLAESDYWEVLLHYKKGWFSGYRSLVDDPNFFLSENGKYDKEAELYATIEGILSYDQIPDVHAQCLFPARTAWLVDELPVLKDHLPVANCPDYDEITSTIDPKKARIVFPYYNLAGPASIFGHTMLKIESNDAGPLRGYAVTYSAYTDDAGPVKYVVYGIGGGFSGYYQVVPYFEKLNEYSAIDQRDLWEYELNFSEEEVMRMYNHIWEMSLVTSDYYFFDENCAYNLLFFLEAARPGLRVTDGYTWVIPIDTVRAVTENDMIQSVNYRPSYVKRMQQMADELTSGEVKLAKKIAAGEVPPSTVREINTSPAIQATILDLSSELVRYEFQGAAPSQLEIYKERSLSILTERAKNSYKSDYTYYRPSVPPEKGHRSSRVLVGAGALDGDFFTQIGIRPAYHSLEDSSSGYMESDIEVLNINLRYYPETGKFNVKEVRIVELTNLNPMTKLFGIPSWQIGVGLDDRSLSADRTLMTGYLDLGFGGAVGITDNIILWGMLKGELQGADRYSSWLSVGAGPKLGLIVPTGRYGKFLLDAQQLWFSDKSRHIEGFASVKYGFYPAKDHALVAGVEFMRSTGDYANEYGISYRYFF